MAFTFYINWYWTKFEVQQNYLSDFYLIPWRLNKLGILAITELPKKNIAWCNHIYTKLNIKIVKYCSNKLFVVIQ